MQSSSLFWTFTSFLLTLMIFSYFFGDNPLFRLATYIFVGVTAGYVAVLIVYQVLLPRLVWPLLHGSMPERALVIFPLLLSILLLTKLSPKFAQLGSIPMAYLVGAGAAVIISGAVTGTIVTQSRAAINMFDMQSSTAQASGPVFQIITASVLLVGTVSSLAYFHFSAKPKANAPAQRTKLMENLAKIGQVFIAITLGALFAGVYATAITALIERLDFILQFLQSLPGLIS
ncbi:MAG: hypothetical protein K8R77_12610 [Anaerolineaceae bacterium]|nr:hypothetical protein [Anaerolineaceae bacterium]